MSLANRFSILCEGIEEPNEDQLRANKNVDAVDNDGVQRDNNSVVGQGDD